MVNIFGGVRHEVVSEVLNLDDRIKLHDYGKSARPGRKAGHISVVGEDLEELLVLGQEAVGLIATDGLA
jgi:5-(carboxyamino)imidazole ribonucleotide synthase